MTYEEIAGYLKRLDLLTALKLLDEQEQDPVVQSLPFLQRLASLLHGQCVENDNRRLMKLLAKTNFKFPNACPEDIDYRADRELDPSQIKSLLTLEFLNRGQSLIMTGATGVGKSWLACAFGNQCARKGCSVKFWRLSELLERLSDAREKGSIRRIRKSIAKTRLLIIDDWGTPALNDEDRLEIYEIVEYRTESGGLLVTSQRPVDQWHAYIGDQNIADSILDRFVHSSHRIHIKGEESMRKLRSPLRSEG